MIWISPNREKLYSCPTDVGENENNVWNFLLDMMAIFSPHDIVMEYPVIAKFENTEKYIYIPRDCRMYISYKKKDILRNSIHRRIFKDKIFFLARHNRVYNTNISINTLTQWNMYSLFQVGKTIPSGTIIRLDNIIGRLRTDIHIGNHLGFRFFDESHIVCMNDQYMELYDKPILYRYTTMFPIYVNKSYTNNTSDSTDVSILYYLSLKNDQCVYSTFINESIPYMESTSLSDMILYVNKYSCTVPYNLRVDKYKDIFIHFIY